MNRRTVLAIAAFALTGALTVGPLGLVAELTDYLRQPVTSSPESRWYTLEEIGLRDRSWENDGSTTYVDRDSGIVDLSDFSCPPRLEVLWDRLVLPRSESWEGGIETGRDTPGYPSLVHNIYGANPDGKFYLYYAIHDPYSGIAVAIAESVDGEFRKLRQLNPWRADSRVLRPAKRPRPTSHFSSPVVVWSPAEKKWFLFFHFFANEWSDGRGHQKTGLAVSESLASHDWRLVTDDAGRLVSVLPTTAERWMNSQSSYHSIHRLPNGIWLAFLRGVGGEFVSDAWVQDVGRLGFAVSADGRRWAQLSGNPIIHQNDGRNGRQGVYRPFFVAKSSRGFLLAWGESDYYDSGPRLLLGQTNDFREITPLSSPLGDVAVADGAISLWREGTTLYAFYGARQRAWNLVEAACPTPAA